MLNVFITIDTEVWPLTSDWRQAGLRRDIDRDIYAITDQGQFGLTYQLKVLKAHDLRAVLFVEPFYSHVAGDEPLRRVVDEIRASGQEIQLHLHPEWLAWMKTSVLPGRTGDNLTDFTEDEQTLLIAHGAKILRSVGVDRISAFRAGTFGANFDTLRALARSDIRLDTSLNACYLNSVCHLKTPGPLHQPTMLEGVCEFPVTCFCDRPGHLRPAQLSACSWRELRALLVQAWRRGWYCVVIVSHSFEFLKRRRRNPEHPMADKIVIRRFEALCRFLEENRDKFRTIGFNELNPADIPRIDGAQPLRGSTRRTFARTLEQLARRVF